MQGELKFRRIAPFIIVRYGVGPLILQGTGSVSAG
jgi:hypothetical protein